PQRLRLGLRRGGEIDRLGKRLPRLRVVAREIGGDALPDEIGTGAGLLRRLRAQTRREEAEEAEREYVTKELSGHAIHHYLPVDKDKGAVLCGCAAYAVAVGMPRCRTRSSSCTSVSTSSSVV